MADNGNASGNGSNGNVGRVEQVQGVVVDVVFEENLPEIYSALKIEVPETGDRRGMDLVLEVQQHLGDDRVRTVAMDAADGLRRGDEVVDTGRPDHGPRRQGDAGPDLQPARRADRRGRRGQGRRSLADPPPRARGRGPHPDPGDPRDRDQGRRPARPLRQGGQGRAVRRRRSRQDGADPGADPKHRRGARGAVGVLRRRRALARGQRPLARDEGVRASSKRRCSSSAR